MRHALNLLLISLISLPLFMLTPRAAQADTVTVFAAASMRGPLDEIAQDWSDTTGHEVILSYAGSGALARQIIAGAPADIFVSASSEWAQAVEAAGVPATDTSRAFLTNSLVLIAGPGASLPPPDFDIATDLIPQLGEGYLAMALVEAVPAGQYGRAALESLGLWHHIAPQVAQTDNVRAALALVASGEAPLGIVYASDALAEPSVRVLAVFPPDLHPEITYAAMLLGAEPQAAARALHEYLYSAEALARFEAAGFRGAPEPGSLNGD